MAMLLTLSATLIFVFVSTTVPFASVTEPLTELQHMARLDSTGSLTSEEHLGGAEVVVRMRVHTRAQVRRTGIDPDPRDATDTRYWTYVLAEVIEVLAPTKSQQADALRTAGYFRLEQEERAQHPLALHFGREYVVFLKTSPMSQYSPSEYPWLGFVASLPGFEIVGGNLRSLGGDGPFERYAGRPLAELEAYLKADPK